MNHKHCFFFTFVSDFWLKLRNILTNQINTSFPDFVPLYFKTAHPWYIFCCYDNKVIVANVYRSHGHGWLTIVSHRGPEKGPKAI